MQSRLSKASSIFFCVLERDGQGAYPNKIQGTGGSNFKLGSDQGILTWIEKKLMVSLKIFGIVA